VVHQIERFAKVKKTARTEPPLSKLSIQLCSSAMMACVVDRPLRLPNWLSSRLGSRNFKSSRPIMDSKTFTRTGRIAIGLRSFSIEEGGLILRTGTISWTLSTCDLVRHFPGPPAFSSPAICRDVASMRQDEATASVSSSFFG